jgi:hypothetical protein
LTHDNLSRKFRVDVGKACLHLKGIPMTDPRSSDIGGSSRDADRGSPPGMPRWVKVVGLAVLVAALVLAAVLLVGGEHGPARHASGGDIAGIAAAAVGSTGG